MPGRRVGDRVPRNARTEDWAVPPAEVHVVERQVDSLNKLVADTVSFGTPAAGGQIIQNQTVVNTTVSNANSAGNFTVNGTLTVTGTSALQGGAGVTGALSAGSLAVTGEAAAGDLKATGLTGMVATRVVGAINGGPPPTGYGPVTGDVVLDYKYQLSWIYNGSVFLPMGPAHFDDQTLGGTQASITIPASGSLLTGFSEIQVAVFVRTTSANVADLLNQQWNADAGSHYNGEAINGSNATLGSGGGATGTSMRCGIISGGGATAGEFGRGWIRIPNYAQSAARIGFTSSVGCSNSAAAPPTGATYETDMGWWFPTALAALTSITLLPSAGSFAANSRVVTTLIP